MMPLFSYREKQFVMRKRLAKDLLQFTAEKAEVTGHRGKKLNHGGTRIYTEKKK